MSKCISRHGEYSEHTPSADDEFTCGLCWVVDEEAMRSALTEAREQHSRLVEAVKGWVGEAPEHTAGLDLLRQILADVAPTTGDDPAGQEAGER